MKEEDTFQKGKGWIKIQCKRNERKCEGEFTKNGKDKNENQKDTQKWRNLLAEENSKGFGGILQNYFSLADGCIIPLTPFENST